MDMCHFKVRYHMEKMEYYKAKCEELRRHRKKYRQYYKHYMYHMERMRYYRRKCKYGYDSSSCYDSSSSCHCRDSSSYHYRDSSSCHCRESSSSTY